LHLITHKTQLFLTAASTADRTFSWVGQPHRSGSFVFNVLRQPNKLLLH